MRFIFTQQYPSLVSLQGKHPNRLFSLAWPKRCSAPSSVLKLSQQSFRCLGLIGLCVFAQAATAGSIQTWNRGGVQIYQQHVDTLPIVDIRVVFKAGSYYSDANSALAHATCHSIGVATQSLSTEELDQEIGLIGAQIGSDIDLDQAWFDFRTLSAPQALARMLDLAIDILSRPQFKQDKLDLLRNSSLLSIESQRNNANSQLAQNSYQTLYLDHPYSRPVIGSAEDYRAITLKDIKAFYQQYYTAQNMTILVVGDIQKQAISAWVDALVEKLAQGKRVPDPAWVKRTPLAKTKYVEMPEVSQVHWNAVSLGLSRTDTQYPNMVTALFVLDKRLDTILRDDHGLTYHSGVWQEKWLGRGIVRIYTSTRAENLPEAQKLIAKTLRGFSNKGVGEEELQQTKTHLAGLLSISYDTNLKLMSLLQVIAKEKLPLDYLQRLISRIREASPEAINQFIQRYFAHREFSKIVVGPHIDKPASEKDAP